MKRLLSVVGAVQSEQILLLSLTELKVQVAHTIMLTTVKTNAKSVQKMLHFFLDLPDPLELDLEPGLATDFSFSGEVFPSGFLAGTGVGGRETCGRSPAEAADFTDFFSSVSCFIWAICLSNSRTFSLSVFRSDSKLAAFSSKAWALSSVALHCIRDGGMHCVCD